ncbi:MAG: DUF2508 family protein [Ruminococcaceae bacterium]|nr:DUF2508 family protein [Oscillospiraceae bacterium]
MKKYLDMLFKKIIGDKPYVDEEILLIKKALYDLNNARNNFNMVVGEDNVELAILELNAAEKRYRNLIKEAKSHQTRFGDLSGELYLE